MMKSRSRSVLDTPLEPVIGLAGGETRWRSMTIFARSDLSAVAQRKAELLRPRSPVIGAHSRDPLASRNDEWGNRFSDNGDVTIGPLPTD